MNIDPYIARQIRQRDYRIVQTAHDRWVAEYRWVKASWLSRLLVGWQRVARTPNGVSFSLREAQARIRNHQSDAVYAAIEDEKRRNHVERVIEMERWP